MERYLEREWCNFAKEMDTEGLVNPEDRELLQLAFYAGACAVWEIWKPPAIVDAIQAEVDEFIEKKKQVRQSLARDRAE